MQIRVGFEMEYQLPAPTPMILALSIHYSRASDLVRPDNLVTQPAVPVTAYRDGFGNWCSRLVAPPGPFSLSTDALLHDTGLLDAYAPGAQQVPVEYLPESTLVYLLGSRYCEVEQLLDFAWQQFGNGPTGWGRVQAICDFTHQRIRFGYEHARRTRTALEAYPGLLAFELIGRRSYKSDDRARQTPDRLIARKDIVDGIEQGRTRLGLRLREEALRRGVLLRPLNDTLYWMPPLVIDDAELDLLAEVTVAAIHAALA